MTRLKNKKALIIIIWLLFMAVANVIFFSVENRLSLSKAKVELKEQADSILKQIPSILDNEKYCLEESSRVITAKTRTMAFELENYETIEEATPFIESYIGVSGLSKVSIYDRDGNLIYGDPEQSILSAEERQLVGIILDSRLYSGAVSFDHYYRDSNSLLDSFMQYSDVFTSNVENTYWGVGNRWLVMVETAKNDYQEDIESYFDWRNIFSRMKVGKGGSIIVISAATEAVDSTAISELAGLEVSELGIKSKDGKGISDYSGLKTMLEQNEDVIQLTIAGKKYYTIQVGTGKTLILAILPVSEVRAEVTSATVILEMLLLLVTGIGTLYALFYSKSDVIAEESAVETDEDIVKSKRNPNRQWNRQLANKIKLIGMISIIGVLGLGIYLEALSSYSDTFDYSRTKVNNVVDLLDNNDVAIEKLKSWFNEEYLTRAKMAECVLSHTDQEVVDKDFLNKLADVLAVKDLYIFDKDGKEVLTNSEYDKRTIDESSDMRVVLEGRPYYVSEPQYDSVSGEVLQMVGIRLKDKNGISGGMLVLVADSRELNAISDKLGYKTIFEQISLSNDSFVMVINEDMTIEYMANIVDGEYIHSFDMFNYTGMSVSLLGVDEDKLRDNYNGNMFVLKNEYFASVKRDGNSFFLVMRPQIGIGGSNILPIIYATIVTGLFMAVLVWIVSVDKEGENKKAPRKRKHAESSVDTDDVRAMMGSLLYKKKPYFEERWPNECRKWREKTPSEKFQTACGFLLVIMLIAIFLHAVIAGRNSIWYYCINGEWDSGINLYSITTCVIATFALIMAKIIIHKLLFYIARAASQRGETICDLLDSFTAYALFIIGIVIFLANFGINLRTITLTGGAIGVIFGIACKNVFDDILSGIIMTLEGVVHDGDLVVYQGSWGVVLSIGVRTTRLKWFNDITVVRNNDFKNYITKKQEETARITTTITIDLNESLERVESIIAREIPDISRKLSKSIEGNIEIQYRGVENINLNGVDLSFAVLVPGMYFGVFRQFNVELKLMCERNGINLAMQQVVVNKPVEYPSLVVEPEKAEN